MGTIKRFEDIVVWQKARQLTKVIYTVTKTEDFSKDWDLRRQIRKASLSIMLNISEGFARRSDTEFAQFLNQAHGSTAEVQSALYAALDQSYIDEDTFQDLYDSAAEISKMIFALERHLRGL